MENDMQRVTYEPLEGTASSHQGRSMKEQRRLSEGDVREYINCEKNVGVITA